MGAKLDEQHLSKIEDNKKRMLEQAQLRQEELEKMKKENEVGNAKRLEGKKQLYYQQMEDQDKKVQGKEQVKQFYNQK